MDEKEFKAKSHVLMDLVPESEIRSFWRMHDGIAEPGVPTPRAQRLRLLFGLVPRFVPTELKAEAEQLVAELLKHTHELTVRLC